MPGSRPIARRPLPDDVFLSVVARAHLAYDTTRADDELLTMQEVADVVRVPVATLRYWRHLGTGPRSFRIGRSVRYWRTEVFAWLDDQANSDRQSVL